MREGIGPVGLHNPPVAKLGYGSCAVRDGKHFKKAYFSARISLQAENVSVGINNL
jgi:hypothetical protein